jgi:hypothetical protein
MPVQRTAYVQGFTDGYMLGLYRACDSADQPFEIGRMNGGLKGYEPRSREWCSGEKSQAAKP